MARRFLQLGSGIFLCCILSLGLLSFTAAGADDVENVYIPLVFSNFPPKDPVFQGSLETEDLVIDSLDEDTADRWTMDLIAGDSITITVAPGNSADIILSVFDGDGQNLVYQQNQSPAGEVETIIDLSIAESGIYNLLVQTVHGQTTDYALMFLDQDSYSFVFRGTLQSNDSREDSLAADVDHFWFFNALSGQAVSFTITPGGSADPYIELYDPDGARLLTIDDTGEGEPESLESYTLLDGGLYGIRVAEFQFGEMDYQLSISIP